MFHARVVHCCNSSCGRLRPAHEYCCSGLPFLTRYKLPSPAAAAAAAAPTFALAKIGYFCEPSPTELSTRVRVSAHYCLDHFTLTEAQRNASAHGLTKERCCRHISPALPATDDTVRPQFASESLYKVIPCEPCKSRSGSSIVHTRCPQPELPMPTRDAIYAATAGNIQ